MGQSEADAAAELAAKWDRARAASKEQEADCDLGREMLRDPEDRVIPITVGSRTFKCRWPSDSLLRQVMAMEAATGALQTLTAEQWDELRGSFAELALQLIWSPTPADEDLLRGDYGFERCRGILTGLMDAYQEGARAVATFRGQLPRPRAR